MGREEMRAADSDRQAVADKLRTALDEGRLDLYEYDERLQQAYAAKTYGDLDRLLTDLPMPALPHPEGRGFSALSGGPGAGSGTAPERQRVADQVTRRWLMQLWSGYVAVVSITIGVWLVSAIASTEWIYFWPVWVAGPWGLILIWQTVGGLSSGEPQRWQAKIDRAERKKQVKRERKAIERGEDTD
jgi:hypothetical protein